MKKKLSSIAGVTLIEILIGIIISTIMMEQCIHLTLL